MLKRALMALGVVAAALGLLITPMSASSASNAADLAAQTCPLGARICLWSDKDFRGVYGAWPGATDSIGSLNDQVSSVINRLPNNAIVLNLDTNQGRAAICIAITGVIKDLDTTFFNDQISSIGVLPGPFCR